MSLPAATLLVLVGVLVLLVLFGVAARIIARGWFLGKLEALSQFARRHKPRK